MTAVMRLLMINSWEVTGVVHYVNCCVYKVPLITCYHQTAAATMTAYSMFWRHVLPAVCPTFTLKTGPIYYPVHLS